MKNKIFILLSLLFLFLTVLILINIDIFLDAYIYQKVSSIISDNLTNKIIIITNICSIYASLLVILLVSLLLVKYKKFYETKVFLITLLIGNIIIFAIKYLVNRDRPNILQLVIENTKSFPSGHAYISTVLYGLILILINKYSKKKFAISLTFIYIIFIFLIGFTRIYLGVHYFSDIIGGYLFGFMTLILAYPLLNKAK